MRLVTNELVANMTTPGQNSYKQLLQQGKRENYFAKGDFFWQKLEITQFDPFQSKVLSLMCLNFVIETGSLVGTIGDLQVANHFGTLWQEILKL